MKGPVDSGPAPANEESAIVLPSALPGAWVALIILCIVNALKNIDRVLVGVLAPSIKLEFTLSDFEIGMLSMAFAVTYALASVPLGRWADTSPRKTIIAILVTIWSFMTAVCGWARSYGVLFVGRMGVAFGESGYLSAAYTMVSDYFSPRFRNLALGLLNCSSSIGVASGLALGGWLAAEYGWRTAFLALGLPGLLIAVLVYFGLREPARGGAEQHKYDAESGRAAFIPSMKLLLSNKLWVWVVILSAFNTFSAVGMVQWLPSFFSRVHHLPLSTIGFVFGTAFGLGMMLGQLSGAVLATRIGRRGVFRPLSICIWSNLLLVPAYLVALWVPHAGAAMLMTIVAAFLGAVGHPAQSAASQNALSPGIRGIGHASLGLLVSVVGMGLGPLLIGGVSDIFLAMGVADSLRYALSVAQIIFLIAGITALRAYALGNSKTAE